MSYFFSKFPIFLLMTFLLFSCNKRVKPENSTDQNKSFTGIKYAKGFDIIQFKNHKQLLIKAPYYDSDDTFEFFLGKDIKDLPEGGKSIQIPIRSLVVTSTTHVPMLELLRVEESLVGFPNTNYISSKKTRKLVDSNRIKELGNEEQINTELLLELKPELVVGFTMSSNNKMFATIEKMNIPVILNGDWLEETPLGRAEWIKFFGVLFDKEQEADSIFSKIESDYLAAKKLAQNATNQPTVLSGGLFKDIWNLPAGESFEATYLRDANTNYLWKDTKGKGSLSLNIENVFERAKNADIWVSPSFYTSIDQLDEANDIYPSFKAFQQKNIYSYANKLGENGGLIYFESSPSRPDLVLKDLIKIAHPSLLPEYRFTFFEKLK
jgi:iron complex transport system substrate-binding protein